VQGRLHPHQVPTLSGTTTILKSKKLNSSLLSPVPFLMSTRSIHQHFFRDRNEKQTELEFSAIARTSPTGDDLDTMASSAPHVIDVQDCFRVTPEKQEYYVIAYITVQSAACQTIK
jgi:hypothetical protein